VQIYLCFEALLWRAVQGRAARLIRAVLFDFWDTLVFYDRREGRKLKRIRVRGLTETLVNAGFPVSLKKMEKTLEEMDAECDRIRERTGREVDLHRQIRMLLEKLGIHESDLNLSRNLWNAYANSALSIKLKVRNGADSVLSLLKRGRYRVGLICNTYHTPSSVVRKILQNVGLYHYFDVLTFSDEYGSLKPRPEIFLETLSKMGVATSEAVHIGDRPDLDVLGAKNAGLKAIYLKLTDQPYPADFPKPDETIKTLRQVPQILKKL